MLSPGFVGDVTVLWRYGEYPVQCPVPIRGRGDATDTQGTHNVYS